MSSRSNIQINNKNRSVKTKITGRETSRVQSTRWPAWCMQTCPVSLARSRAIIKSGQNVQICGNFISRLSA